MNGSFFYLWFTPGHRKIFRKNKKILAFSKNYVIVVIEQANKQCV
ncbi:hypothetical protein K420107F6_10550 [Lactonifactor longoviformis]